MKEEARRLSAARRCGQNKPGLGRNELERLALVAREHTELSGAQLAAQVDGLDADERNGHTLERELVVVCATGKLKKRLEESQRLDARHHIIAGGHDKKRTIAVQHVHAAHQVLGRGEQLLLELGLVELTAAARIRAAAAEAGDAGRTRDQFIVDELAQVAPCGRLTIHDDDDDDE